MFDSIEFLEVHIPLMLQEEENHPGLGKGVSG